jgi:hypothetical protein
MDDRHGFPAGRRGFESVERPVLKWAKEFGSPWVSDGENRRDATRGTRRFLDIKKFRILLDIIHGQIVSSRGFVNARIDRSEKDATAGR